MQTHVVSNPHLIHRYSQNLHEEISSHGSVVLTGPCGSGKSSRALESVQEHRSRGGSVVYVDTAGDSFLSSALLDIEDRPDALLLGPDYFPVSALDDFWSHSGVAYLDASKAPHSERHLRLQAWLQEFADFLIVRRERRICPDNVQVLVVVDELVPPLQDVAALLARIARKSSVHFMATMVIPHWGEDVACHNLLDKI